MIYDYLRQRKTTLSIDEFTNIEATEIDFDFLFKKELNDNQKKLSHFFKLLGEKCKEVLTLFYYRGLTIEEIAAFLNYNNKDVVKSQKSRCLKSLKDKMNGNE
jgi:RNA polymerase sigma factor (sigma-70 family)